MRSPVRLIESRLARKEALRKEQEKVLKMKTYRMITERCKRCGGMVLRIQKGANKNRYVCLDAKPVTYSTGNVRRVTVYKKHRCRETNPQVRKRSGST